MVRLIPMTLGMDLEKRWHQVSARFLRCALVMPILFFSTQAGMGQKSPQSFWELRPESMDAMLQQSGDDTSHRYARLRQYFGDLHCRAEFMHAQSIPKGRGTNLECVLPGDDSEQIVVAARYDRRRRDVDPAEGWTEAVMLPLLYNALLAGRRHYTFVFVELSGSAGEQMFLDSLRKNLRRLPKAMVVLDQLGLSAPWYCTPEAMLLTAKGRERAAIQKKLLSDADFTVHLQGLVSLNAERENFLLSDANMMAAILVYSVSNWNTRAKADNVRQDFEFLAYYLCRIDGRLIDPPATASHP